ncbi:Uncharacterised protein [Mycobacteroides abscessus subsp. abscessus]|nr:Uncharacterised protein [Mycobacteroides abscessus subsp. abscessus]
MDGTRHPIAMGQNLTPILFGVRKKLILDGVCRHGRENSRGL